ncbi:MAG: cob(I)yrinic acid a,c-diamide adenosyltransferase [Phycisphaeraceae bacterium]|nr:cob(I)yrinic acid a,c-diamide adenosyltransferase [Phycisphaeraceae bacterium]MCW5753415.1 cob(I)yrinic acid a,c-diamide adenosyltransferase [Phycisphaeraceae bacterium]
MVKLNRIYTRTGDDGTTGLVTGERIAKSDIRVHAYGEVDETNACIGIAIVHASRPDAWQPSHRRLARELRGIQHDLFDLGADLATPVGKADAADRKPLRIIPAQTERLEKLIDEFNARLSPLRSFVLPGGTPLAASLHLARTVCRRAERTVANLLSLDPDRTSLETLRYLNRLSDLLFVLCRVANDDGTIDELWVPGSGRI